MENSMWNELDLEKILHNKLQLDSTNLQLSLFGVIIYKYAKKR